MCWRRLKRARSHTPKRSRSQSFALKRAPIQDAAWRTASSTGALSYMDYAEVERFSDAYKEQALLQTMEEQALDDYLQLMPRSYHPSLQRKAPFLRGCEGMPSLPSGASSLISTGCWDVGQGTIGAYQEALKK